MAPAQADVLRDTLHLKAFSGQPDTALIARAAVNALRAIADTAEGKRLVVAIDDEQWLDEDTRRLLGMAVAWLPDIPVTWIVSARSEQAEDGLGQVLAHEIGADLVRLDLAGLDEASIVSVITDRFAGRWSSRLLRHIIRLANGNPYVALELARETMTVADRDAAIAHLPRSLTGSLRARLNRLAPTTMAVIQIAALDTRPTRQLLRAVAGEHVDDAVDEALASDVLESSPPNPVLRFTHPLLREVTRATLSGPVRRRLHRALAAAVAVEDLDEAAGHLAAGAEEPDETLAATVSAAAERMLSQGAPGRAVILAEAAVALTPDANGLPAWRRRLLELDCLMAASEWDRCRVLAEQWVADVPDRLRGELTARRGWIETDVETAARLLATALTEFENDPARAARVGTELAQRVGVLLLRLTEAKTVARKAVRQARRAESPAVLRGALATEGFLAALAGRPDAGRLLRNAISVAGLESMPFPYRSPESRLAMWHMWRGELGPARELHHAVLEAGERRGSEESCNGSRLHLAEVEWRAGRWAEAARHAASVERYGRETGYRQTGGGAYVVSLVAAGRGEIEKARRLAGEGLRISERQGDLIFAAQCRCVLGQLELSVDDPAAAITWLAPLVPLLKEHGFGEPGAFPYIPDLIESYARVGRTDEARECLKWLRKAADRLHHPWAGLTGGRAEAVLHLALRDSAAAVQAVTGSVLEARERKLPLELGRSLLVLGTAQRRARRRRDAAQTLDEATAVLDQLGASCWAALARAQRARLAHSSEAVLTPSEQRVVELVSQGLTNTEIAAIMLISVKTVEANLTRVYRKLGVRGRVELAKRMTG
ncbi:DNA-binding CsgD family transcriptional regulator [Streptosporangium lutulentum]|uniref:DNA-binding CsgD family transcriptional regulator n=2 Tax=Streptosporangium lutulentum TaxID=1461250 RepID=A0ABT9QG84_9ACTN|nr:DNA-binding CsgD family transcriptional regulator [Streptosporangium lutulentum]